MYSPAEDTIYDSETAFGIKSLRPGRGGSNQTGPGFDEAAANKWMPTMPDALKMKGERKDSMPGQWAKQRAEILEDFDFFEYRGEAIAPVHSAIHWSNTRLRNAAYCAQAVRRPEPRSPLAKHASPAKWDDAGGPNAPEQEFTFMCEWETNPRPRIRSITRSDNVVQLSIDRILPGTTNYVESTSAIESNEWSVIDTFIGPALGLKDWFGTAPSGATRMFYRIRSVQPAP